MIGNDVLPVSNFKTVNIIRLQQDVFYSVQSRTWKSEVHRSMCIKQWRTEFKQTEKCKFPTKKGRRLSSNLELFKSLALSTTRLQCINKNEDLHYNIGGNIILHVTVRSDNPCVDIRKYWKPNKTGPWTVSYSLLWELHWCSATGESVTGPRIINGWPISTRWIKLNLIFKTHNIHAGILYIYDQNK